MSGNVDKTLWVGNLHDKVTEELLYELFLQAGPLDKVTIPKDKDGKRKRFAFVSFLHDCSVPYTIQLMDGTQLYGRDLKLQTRPGSSHTVQQCSGGSQMQGGNYSNQVQMRDRPPINHYQNSQPIIIDDSPVPPPNPFASGLPMRDQSTGPGVPVLNKSNTWHGTDLSLELNSQISDFRGQGHSSRGQGHSRDTSRDRDSHFRHRDHSRDRSRDHNDHRGGNSSHHSRDIEAQRQRVLEAQRRALEIHRHHNTARYQGHPYQRRY